MPTAANSSGNTTWAERVELASETEQRRMGFGPFMVHLGHLTTMLDNIVRTPRSSSVPAPWPIAPAPGWLATPIDNNQSITLWCALGGEWVFRRPEPDKKHIVFINPACTSERRDSVLARVGTLSPFDLLDMFGSGEAFAFCDSLFVVPEKTYVMNSWIYHPEGREPLSVFLGFRGHPRRYPDIISPGIYRAHNRPDDESVRRFRRKIRVAANVVKQGVFEHANQVLSNVQARGVLQHYGIIGPTDVTDLSYDVNVAKWFALNEWGRVSGAYRTKRFLEHADGDKAYDECSNVYTVAVRAIGTWLEPDLVAEMAELHHLTLQWTPQDPGEADAASALKKVAVRNISPLWSERAERQSGFGLVGVGPRDDDAWGSVLGIYEHSFHPTFCPNGWDRIGGSALTLAGRSYGWDEDTSGLADYALPRDDECIRWIRWNVRELERRLNL